MAQYGKFLKRDYRSLIEVKLLMDAAGKETANSDWGPLGKLAPSWKGQLAIPPPLCVCQRSEVSDGCSRRALQPRD
jgi:hypothetical protein